MRGIEGGIWFWEEGDWEMVADFIGLRKVDFGDGWILEFELFIF